MDEQTIDRIFAGGLIDLPPVSSKIVRIFTSSTFTDMLMERNTLMEYVYPRIKEYCREKHGLEIQVNFYDILVTNKQVIKNSEIKCFLLYMTLT